MNDRVGVCRVETQWTVDSDVKQLQSKTAKTAESVRTFLPQRLAKQLLLGDLVVAREHAREALNADPRDPQGLFLLGAVLRKEGRLEQACTILQPLVELQPDSGDAWHELGLAQAQLGRRELAVDALLRAIDFSWRDTEAWFALGSLLTFPQSARVDESAIIPQLEDAKKALREQGPGMAEKIMRDLIREEPDNARAIKLLADLLFPLARWPELAALLKRCLEIAPDYVAARFRYATVLFLHGNFHLALPHIDELLKTDPGNALYHAIKALALGWRWQFEPAIAEFESFMNDYHKPGLWLEYARLLRNAKADTTLAAYKKTFEILPSFVDAYISLASSKSIRMDETIIARVRAELANGDLATESRARLHFVLGKAYEDLGRYAESFENYSASNDILSAVRGSGSDSREFLRQTKTVYVPAFFNARRDVGHAEPGAIFIVGMFRAGSTLVEQIISSHSQVEALGELKYLPEIVPKIVLKTSDDRIGFYPNRLRGLDPRRFRTIGEQYMAAVRPERRAGTPFFTDKMPSNYTQTGLIHLALPNAKIIDARRHPLDCCFSCFKHYFPAGQTATLTLRDVGRAYADYVELMAHFDEVLPGKVHRVIYENLIGNFEMEVRRLLDYLGLPFEDACLNFHENRRLVRTLSSEQVRTPLYKTGMAQWRHYEPWLGPLKEELGYVLDIYPAVPKYYPELNVNFASPLRLGEAGRRFHVVKGLEQMPFEIASQS